MTNVKERIIELKKKRNAAILAHYYVPDEVQEIADHMGDSYYLSVIASQIKEKVILFCGVYFMAESVKIMNPDKTVLMPDPGADCPMAHMAATYEIESMRDKYEDLAVVCYINSTAETKAHSDVCVTSSNALKVIRSLPQKNIFFIPDKNLGRYISLTIPEKNFIFNDGFCCVHAGIRAKDVLDLKKEHPEAKVVTHPECREEITGLSDHIGSTSSIIDYVEKCYSEEFIVCTERGIFHELNKRTSGKCFYTPSKCTVCMDMKKNTLENVLRALEEPGHEIHVDEEMAAKALQPLQNMLKYAKSE
ncbi:MAG: quinolinate synthase [Synergistetes bacterium HGW-Synergistetes-1]|nr:MAG: quinolinate synthase [Synergistetes bacterium HGW-Synergistetes-1]